MKEKLRLLAIKALTKCLRRIMKAPDLILVHKGIGFGNEPRMLLAVGGRLFELGQPYQRHYGQNELRDMN